MYGIPCRNQHSCQASGTIYKEKLIPGKIITFSLDREWVIPRGIALLFLTNDWTFRGYCEVTKIIISEKETQYTIKILTVFTDSEQKLYSDKFKQAADITGELQK